MSGKLELESFLDEGIKSLKKIDAIINKFNGFEVIKKVHSELIHSNILAWLLDPFGNHGLNKIFLSKFLNSIIPDSQYLDSIKYNDFKIFSEKSIHEKRIDLLVISEENSLVIGIENKILGTEMNKQLYYYFKGITEEYTKFSNKFFVYLTPEGIPPSDEENWIAFDYSKIEDIIVDILNKQKSVISDEVYGFLDQYSKILNRYITKRDLELEKICENLFKEFKNALNIIFQYKPDIHSEIQKIIIQLIKSNEDLILGNTTKHIIKFTSKKLDNLIPKEGALKWSKEDRVLLFEFKSDNYKMKLQLVIGPAKKESDIREKLLKIARKELGIFKEAKSDKITKKYRQIYRKDILSKKFYEDENMDIIKKRISSKYNEFLKELIKIENHFIKYYK